MNEPSTMRQNNGGRQTPGPSAPVGDIEVKKKSGTYNTYTLRLSMGQIECVHAALSKDHANPIADELLKLFEYYLKNVPGPGEEEEDLQAQDEEGAMGGPGAPGDPGAEGEDGGDDVPLPMPPGYEGDGRTTVAGEGPEDDLGGGGDEFGGDEPGAGGPPSALPGGDEQGGGPEDDLLPAPPRE